MRALSVHAAFLFHADLFAQMVRYTATSDHGINDEQVEMEGQSCHDKEIFGGVMMPQTATLCKIGDQ